VGHMVSATLTRHAEFRLRVTGIPYCSEDLRLLEQLREERLEHGLTTSGLLGVWVGYVGWAPNDWDPELFAIVLGFDNRQFEEAFLERNEHAGRARPPFHPVKATY